MELAGKVIAVLEPRGGVSKTGNEWKVQEYVIETHDQYPKKMCFDVFGADKIAQFNIQAGEELNVFFDVDAREWNGRSRRRTSRHRDLTSPVCLWLQRAPDLTHLPF